jgi:hypothetical protein
MRVKAHYIGPKLATQSPFLESRFNDFLKETFKRF